MSDRHSCFAALRTVEPLESRTLLSTYYLSPSGNDAAAGTVDAPWRNLQASVDRVGRGDTLVLRGGVYGGGVVVTRADVTIRSFDGERATIAAPLDGAGEASAIEFRSVSGGRLFGLDISGGFYGVKLNGEWGYGRNFASGVVIRNCIIHDTAADGVKITAGCDDVAVQSSEIFNTGRRDDNAQGIDDVNGDRLVVRGNWIHDVRSTGVFAKGGAIGCVIEDNRVERCGLQGVSLGFYTSPEFFDADNKDYFENVDGVVRNNVIRGTRFAGIGLYGALRPGVFNNTLVDVASAGQAGILLSPGTVEPSPGRGVYAPVRSARIYNNVVEVARPEAGVAGTSPAVQLRVVDGHTPLGGKIRIDNNLYFGPGGGATFRDELIGDPTAGSLKRWRRLVKGDRHSRIADPQVDGTGRPAKASPAVDAGVRIDGFADDMFGTARPQGKAWDIGAGEQSG